MTVIVTRNVPDRFRGFLSSCMLELAPGVYTNPGMTAGIRERVWAVCCEWAGIIPDDGGILLTWYDKASPGNQGLLTLGWPKKDITEVDGLWLEFQSTGSLTTE